MLNLRAVVVTKSDIFNNGGKLKAVMKEETHQGIVLRSIDFKDRQKIVTIFTKERGLVSCIIKGISLKAPRLMSLSSLFTEAEYVVSNRKSDILQFIDGTTLEENLFLRQSYAHLQTAGAFGKAILRSQLPHKSSPLLYELFKFYLKELKNFDDPTSLLSSYYLKILQHEGLFSWRETCSVCESHPTEYIHKGESFCFQHGEPYFHRFSKEEWLLVKKLAEARKMQEIKEVKASFEFSKKIEKLFEESTL